MACDELRRARHGPRHDVVETLADLLDTYVASLDVGYACRLAYAFDDGDLLAYGVCGHEVRLGEHYGQRHAREASAAADVEDAGAAVETADGGNGERMEHVTYVQLAEILARDDVYAGVPLGVGFVQRGELSALMLRNVGEIFQYELYHRSVVCFVVGRCVSPSAVS